MGRHKKHQDQEPQEQVESNEPALNDAQAESAEGGELGNGVKEPTPLESAIKAAKVPEKKHNEKSSDFSSHPKFDKFNKGV